MTENRTKITIAIIGLIGILGGAFFANWDKIFQPSPEPLPAPSPEPTPTPPEYSEYIHKPPHEQPPHEVPDEIPQRIEYLQRDLENNERETIKAHEEIERLRPFLQTDRDAQQAIDNQEKWLKDLEMQRNQVERGIQRLRERR